MAVMDGEEAFRYIREIRPHVPVLIASGYGESCGARTLRPRRQGRLYPKAPHRDATGEKIKALFDAPQQIQLIEILRFTCLHRGVELCLRASLRVGRSRFRSFYFNEPCGENVKELTANSSRHGMIKPILPPSKLLFG